MLKRSLVKAFIGEAKSAKKKRDEMTTQLRSTCAMISKVTAFEKTKSPRNSYENLVERSAAMCALWTSATVSLRSGKDIDCEELKLETHELERMLQALDVDAKGIKRVLKRACVVQSRLLMWPGLMTASALERHTCKRYRRVIAHVSLLIWTVSP